jgi:acyl-coenzyme A synthetase/AMP-(fatty) acid ligase
LPAAVIQKLPGYDHLSEQQIFDAVANEFQKSKHLVGGVYFVDNLKLFMTPTGKIKKNLVKAMATELHKSVGVKVLINCVSAV